MFIKMMRLSSPRWCDLKNSSSIQMPALFDGTFLVVQMWPIPSLILCFSFRCGRRWPLSQRCEAHKLLPPLIDAVIRFTLCNWVHGCTANKCGVLGISFSGASLLLHNRIGIPASGIFDPNGKNENGWELFAVPSPRRCAVMQKFNSALTHDRCWQDLWRSSPQNGEFETKKQNHDEQHYSIVRAYLLVVGVALFAQHAVVDDNGCKFWTNNHNSDGTTGCHAQKNNNNTGSTK